MVQNWLSMLKNWLDGFCKNEYKDAFACHNVANFQLKLMILVQEPFQFLSNLVKLTQAQKAL